MKSVNLTGRILPTYLTKAARGVFLDNIVAEVSFDTIEVVDPSRPKPDVVRDPLPDVVVFKVMHCLEEVHDLCLCACRQFFYRSPANKCAGCVMSRLVGDSQCGVCYEKTSTPCCQQTLCPVCDANVDACPFCRREFQYHYHGAADEEETLEDFPLVPDPGSGVRYRACTEPTSSTPSPKRACGWCRRRATWRGVNGLTASETP